MSSTSTDNGDNTTISGIKRDQQKEENRDKDNSKREKRQKAVLKSIQYRPVCVQPEDDNDDDKIHKLCKEMPANISLKPKPKTSDVLTIYWHWGTLSWHSWLIEQCDLQLFVFVVELYITI